MDHPIADCMSNRHDAGAELSAPSSVAALGIPEGLAEDLFMRRILADRMTTIGRAADTLKVSHAVGDELAESLRQKNLLEYHGLDGRDYRVSLTEAGQRTTTDRLRMGSHVSTMPVPVVDYRRIVEAQRAQVQVTREITKQAFADMVVEDNLLDQIGPAFLGDGAIFLYGPPGTGKTSLAERMARFYGDAVVIPRVLEVEGQLISVFDPAVHDPIDQQPPQLDPRFVLCRRPLVMVGGELTMPMMDLNFDPLSGMSTAPIQLLANNGILVLDDFGRQTATPDEILNRWIVPLSRGIDFLRPHSGNKFTVPFEVKLVISTNLDPYKLGDDAFLRRLRNKVYVGACSEPAFNWILVRAADRMGMEITQAAAAHMVELTKSHLGELRPYVAHDLCELALGLCEYDGLSHQLNPRLLDRAAAVYFVQGAYGRPCPAAEPDAEMPTFAPNVEAEAGMPTRPTGTRRNDGKGPAATDGKDNGEDATALLPSDDEDAATKTPDTEETGADAEANDTDDDSTSTEDEATSDAADSDGGKNKAGGAKRSGKGDSDESGRRRRDLAVANLPTSGFSRRR